MNCPENHFTRDQVDILIASSKEALFFEEYTSQELINKASEYINSFLPLVSFENTVDKIVLYTNQFQGFLVLFKEGCSKLYINLPPDKTIELVKLIDGIPL